MSAFKSFANSLFNNNDSLEATMHATNFCEGGKQGFSLNAVLSYKKGWYSIVEKFYKRLRNQPVVITSMLSDYGQLDIILEVTKGSAKALIWEACETVRRESRSACMECGNNASPFITYNKVVVLCKDCKYRAEKTGETGTWLDKF